VSLIMTVSYLDLSLFTGWSQIVSLALSIFHKVVTDTIKHSDISGTSELIIYFKWYGIIAQSAALFTSTHAHHTYMLYTCFSSKLENYLLCKLYILSSLMCAFSSTLRLLEKDQ